MEFNAVAHFLKIQTAMFIRSLTHSCIHLFVRSPTHSSIHPFIHAFVRSFTHSFVCSFISSFICLFFHSVVHPTNKHMSSLWGQAHTVFEWLPVRGHV